jgi:hypothetical protein
MGHGVHEGPYGSDRFNERWGLGSAGRPYDGDGGEARRGGADTGAPLSTCVSENVHKARPRKGSSLGTEGGAAVRLGVASASEVGLERVRAHARTDKGKAQRRAPVLGDQKLGRAARDHAHACEVKGECACVLPGRAWDQAELLCSAATHASVRTWPACRRS